MGPFIFISRNGTRIIALATFIGLALPELAQTFRPYLGGCVTTMLCVSLLRVDLAAFFARLRRPLPSLVAAFWIVIVIPLVLMSLAVVLGPPLSGPVVLAMLFLVAAPSPIVSAPAFAMLMGLDGALVLAVTLAGTVVLPLTAPLIAGLFVAEELPIGVGDLALRLALIIGVASVASLVLRRVFGPRRIVAAKPVLDTVSVGIAIIFAIAAMEGVTWNFLHNTTFAVLALGFVVLFAAAQLGVTYLAFRPFVGADAVAIAYAASNRNSGLVVAALGASAVNDTVWLFFALSQIPIFFFPLVLQSIGRRLSAPAPGVAAPRSPS